MKTHEFEEITVKDYLDLLKLTDQHIIVILNQRKIS